MRKRGIAFLVVVSLFLVVLFSLSLSGAQNSTVQTNMTVIYNNSLPYLSQDIPNQTWPMNTNLTNAFDLDDYARLEPRHLPQD